MRKRAALLAAGLLAGATMSVTGAAPAQAQTCQSTGDPVFAYVCLIVNNVPEPGPTIDHYYYVVFSVTDKVYCTLSPSC